MASDAVSVRKRKSGGAARCNLGREAILESDSFGFEVLASSLRADAGDLKAFMEALATKLEGALPSQTTVTRRGGGLFSGSKRVDRIMVDLGDYRYELQSSGSRVQPSRSKAVRGIVLKTEQIPLDEWIDELSRQLTAEAQRSEQARLALERLLGV